MAVALQRRMSRGPDMAEPRRLNARPGPNESSWAGAVCGVEHAGPPRHRDMTRSQRRGRLRSFCVILPSLYSVIPCREFYLDCLAALTLFMTGSSTR